MKLVFPYEGDPLFESIDYVAALDSVPHKSGEFNSLNLAMKNATRKQLRDMSQIVRKIVQEYDSTRTHNDVLKHYENEEALSRVVAESRNLNLFLVYSYFLNFVKATGGPREALRLLRGNSKSPSMGEVYFMSSVILLRSYFETKESIEITDAHKPILLGGIDAAESRLGIKGPL
jgi:hypothetical protein